MVWVQSPAAPDQFFVQIFIHIFASPSYIKNVYSCLFCKSTVHCRSTVRDVIHCIDPQRAAAMRNRRLQRRQYVVKGPNHMWHVDGNDKLKRFGICIHGAIDGWSRRLIWLEVDETNKNPRLTCTHFLNSVRELKKVPLIVRMDRGTENVNIADVQMLLRSHHNDRFTRCAVMYGSSNHNQRIERFWQYLRQSLLQSYMDLFKDLEVSGVLQTDNILHIECLKFCFMPVIRNEVQLHAHHWNKHRVRKMKNVRSPSGIPNLMYTTPELYGCNEQGKVADEIEVAHCLQINYCERNQYGCQNVFSDWAVSVIEQFRWQMPTNLDGAFELFSNLILEIYASE